ncbi:MAG TPA: hypothetical protein VNW23_03340, partial [Opitutaceae bacterium]|nr:hypothetical protein [Opitutaceae bacterium]
LERSRNRPEELVIFACHGRAIARVEGLPAPAAVNLSPVARDYPSRAFSGFFRPPCCDCSIKEREEVAKRLMQTKDFLPHNLLTVPAAVNNLGAILYAGYSRLDAEGAKH